MKIFTQHIYKETETQTRQCLYLVFGSYKMGNWWDTGEFMYALSPCRRLTLNILASIQCRLVTGQLISTVGGRHYAFRPIKIMFQQLYCNVLIIGAWTLFECW